MNIGALLSVLLNSPERAILHPWERCFDLRNEVLFYKNAIDGTIIIDLRRQVNLGDGLFHTSNMWQELTGYCCIDHYPANLQNPSDCEQPPFLMHATCCGPLVYLLVPDSVNRCPLCFVEVAFISWAN